MGIGQCGQACWSIVIQLVKSRKGLDFPPMAKHQGSLLHRGSGVLIVSFSFHFISLKPFLKFLIIQSKTVDLLFVVTIF